MTSEQQKQTLEYFNAFAADWRRKAEGGIAERVNVIAQRNQAALRALESVRPARRWLDLGCGTGEMVIEAAGRGLDAIGVDFAPEMIALCRDKAPAQAQGRAEFRVGSIFDLTAEDGSFDVVSGLGLIEYLSRDELLRLLALAARWIRPGGALTLGSRNRLFNLVSLNDYTTMEVSLGAVDALVGEACAITEAATMRDALAAARTHAKAYPEAARHPGTGIRVETRHQYTPGQLAELLAAAGFAPTRAFPIHYHALPPAAAKA